MHGFKQGQNKVRKIGIAKGRGWAGLFQYIVKWTRKPH